MKIPLHLTFFACHALSICDSGKDNPAQVPDTSNPPEIPVSGPTQSTAKPPVPAGDVVTITAAEPSIHFAEVLSHLDVGGKQLVFRDHTTRRQTAIDTGQWFIDLMITEDSKTQLPEDFDLEALVDATGLFSSGASGSSIDKDGEAFLMRSYTHYPEGITSWVKLAGDPKPWRAPSLLPKGTDLMFEGRMDGRHLPAMLMQMAVAVGQREPAVEWLGQPTPTGMTRDELLSMAHMEVVAGAELHDNILSALLPKLKGWYLEVKTSPELMKSAKPLMVETLGEPGPISDYIGWAAPVPFMPGTDKLDGRILLVGDDTILLVSSEPYLRELTKATDKLANHPDFLAGANHFPKQGNMMMYASPDITAAAGKLVMYAMDSGGGMDDQILSALKNMPIKLKGRPWSFCMATSEKGVATYAEVPVIMNAETMATAYFVGAVPMLFVGAKSWKKGSDRSAVILNIRNCQQAMRGEQNMKQLNTGDSFTRKDLEQFMKFPEDIQVEGGWIRFTPGDKITPESGDPAKNGNHLWLKVSGPGIKVYVGEHGFDSIEDTTGW